MASQTRIIEEIKNVVGHYAENTFQVSTKYIEKYHHIFGGKCEINRSKDLAVMVQAIDSLNNIFEDEELIPKMSDFISLVA